MCPRTDLDMSRYGFNISLDPRWKEFVAGADLDQEKVNRMIKTCGPGWSPLRGPCLLPHNVDNLSQKMLLLIVFTEIAETIIYVRKEKT